MFGAFSRSWEITKLSFSVIKQDKEMLFFPVIASIASLIFIVLMSVPYLLPALIQGARFENLSEVVLYVIMFFVYFGLAFIATFFNVCVVYTTKVRFEGGNATFFESLTFASSKIHLIFAWSLVSASVGLILRLIDRAAERAGGIAQIIISILNSIFGLLWSIITIFVVPAMVYNNCGPLAAIKSSVNAIKKTWGESLIRHYGLGLIQFIVNLIGTLILIPLFIFFAMLGPFGIAFIATIAVIYYLVVNLVFGVANSIFNTALYVYANSGQIPGGYNREILQNTFKVKTR